MLSDLSHLLTTGVPIAIIDDMFILGLAMSAAFIPLALVITGAKAGWDWLSRVHHRSMIRGRQG